ncbi:MAG: UDP-2,3-diacylglucosamine diphosphatase [Pseudomonadota bacterium]
MSELASNFMGLGEAPASSARLTPQGPGALHRTLFISDCHLGSKNAKATYLLDFLRANEADTLYLVGDIIDGLQLKRSGFWDETHSAVLEAIFQKAASGTQVIYIPGNHDAWLRTYAGHRWAGIDIRLEDTFEAADGRRYLVTHGDAYDGFCQRSKLTVAVGDIAYTACTTANNLINRARRRLGRPYWPATALLKRHLKGARALIERFEAGLVAEADRRGVDGVICGHIHHAALQTREGLAYCNTGDWVESCTALVEDQDGRLRLVHGTEITQIWFTADALAKAA